MSENEHVGMKRKVPYVLSAIRLFMLPAIGILILQCLSAYQQNFDEIVFYSPHWFTAIGVRFVWNYLLLLLPYLILYALPYFKITSAILNLAVFLFGIGEHYVVLFRNTIIYPWDLVNIDLALKVSRTYDFVISKEVILAGVLFLVMTALSFVGKEPKFKVWLRGLLAALLTAALCLYMGFFVMQRGAQQSTGIRFYYTIVNYNYENGVLLNFGYHIRFLFREKPQGYSKDEVEKDLAQYDTKTASLVPDGEKPDIIMIMSEAYSDLAVNGDFGTNEPVTPFMDSLTGDQVIKKDLVTSCYGGNTANSEFEVLTSMSMEFIPAGTYPFRQYIRHDISSIASQLKDIGYETDAVHPFDLTGWNRTKVMPLLGFDSLVGLTEFTDPLLYRSYVSDQSLFEYAIRQYEEHKAENPDVPLFQYLITIQNHGGYATNDTLPYSITPDSYSQYPQAEEYLSLLRTSDEALKMLISYYENVDTPTVIIFYGDHQPNLTDKFSDFTKLRADKDDPQYLLKRYETQLLVWANYDISDSDLAQIKEDYISTNYLSTYLADIIGVQRTPFQQFLFEMHDAVPALNESYVVASDGTLYNAGGSLNPEIKPWIDIYRKYQYYQLYDSRE